jgi:hypothetical protein
MCIKLKAWQLMSYKVREGRVQWFKHTFEMVGVHCYGHFKMLRRILTDQNLSVQKIFTSGGGGVRGSGWQKRVSKKNWRAGAGNCKSVKKTDERVHTFWWVSSMKIYILWVSGGHPQNVGVHILSTLVQPLHPAWLNQWPCQICHGCQSSEIHGISDVVKSMESQM